MTDPENKTSTSDKCQYCYLKITHGCPKETMNNGKCPQEDSDYGEAY